MSTPSRPFRFGVQLARARSAAEWREQARRAEALGYDVFLMPDHFGAQFAIGPALAIAAEATSTIRIGTLVWQNDLRHPALVAKEAATLDVLSEGRFELGIGAGGSFLPDYEWTGIPFDPPGRRVRRLEESVHLIKEAFSSETVTFAGEYFQFDSYQGYPKPFQQPTPPFLIAGGGKRMLRLAAREADIVGLLPGMKPDGGSFYDDHSVAAFTDKAAFVRAEAGDRAAAIEFNILVQQVKVTDDRAGAIEHFRNEHEIEDPSWFESPMVYIGSVDEIVEKLRAMREQVGTSYFVVFEPVMEEFAPVVARLSGQ